MGYPQVYRISVSRHGLVSSIYTCLWVGRELTLMKRPEDVCDTQQCNVHGRIGRQCVCYVEGRWMGGPAAASFVGCVI